MAKDDSKLYSKTDINSIFKSNIQQKCGGDLRILSFFSVLCVMYISLSFLKSLLKINHSIRSIRDSYKANSTMVSHTKKATSSADDEGAFYHVFFLRRVLQTSSVRATVSEEIESFRVSSM